jgi:hypothetical protein
MPDSALNTQFEIGDGANPENFVNIAELKTIGGLGATRDTIDTSILSSDWDRVMVGIKKSKEITLEVNFDPEEGTHDTTTGVLADFDNGTQRNFRFVFPNGAMFTFAAFVKEWEISGIEVNGVIGGKFVVKPTGAMSFSAGS